MCQKRFTADHDTQEREENLRNTKEIIADFKEKISIEIQRQKKIEMVEE